MLNKKNEPIIFNSRKDAQETLDAMRDIMERYGYVTVADLHDLVGLTNGYTDIKYGWKKLKNVLIGGSRDGYKIYLPNPVELDAAGLDTDGDPVTLTFPNEDDGRDFLKLLGTTINLSGNLKTVVSVIYTVAQISIELR